MMQRDRGSDKRRAAVKVKTAKRRQASSTRWLARQLNDPYVEEAKHRGYRSRAAFKLIQLDDRLKFLKPGALVVDLGAAPGGWSQIAAQRVKANDADGRVVAVDLQSIDPIPGVEFLEVDFFADDAPAQIGKLLNGPVDVVLSDMAAPSTGHAATDHLRIMALAEAAYAYAEEILAPEGTFIAKVLQGGTESELLATLKRTFRSVKHVKPPASRKESAELYVVASGFRGVGSRI